MAFSIGFNVPRTDGLRFLPYQEKVVVFWFTAQILEHALLPVALHQIPVFDLAVAHGILDRVGLLVGHRLVADEKVEVFNAALARDLSSGASSGCLLHGHAGRDNELRVAVSSVSQFRVPDRAR